MLFGIFFSPVNFLFINDKLFDYKNLFESLACGIHQTLSHYPPINKKLTNYNICWIEFLSFNLSSDIFLTIIRETVINISSNPSSDILLSRYLYIQYPSGNSSNEFFFTTLFFHDNVTLSALFAIARAFVCVRAGCSRRWYRRRKWVAESKATDTGRNTLRLSSGGGSVIPPSFPSFPFFLPFFLSMCRVSFLPLLRSRLARVVVIAIIRSPGGSGESAS